MKPALLFILCISFIASNAQLPPAIQWQRCYGGTKTDQASDILQTSDGGYIIVGSSNSNDWDILGNHGNNDAWIAKIDPLGNIAWKKTFGGSKDEAFRKVRQTNDGGFIVGGISASSDGDVPFNRGDYDIWIIKLTSMGDPQWEYTYGGSMRELLFSIEQTTDGGYIVNSSSNSNNFDITNAHGGVDDWVIKLDALGSIQWQNSFGGTNEETSGSLIQTPDGGYLFTSLCLSTDGDVSCTSLSMQSTWLVKLTSAGNIQWQKCFRNNVVANIQVTPDGGYMLTGSGAANSAYPSNPPGYHALFDVWLCKIDASANIQWEKCYGGSQHDFGAALIQTSDGGYIVGGSSYSSDADLCRNYGPSDCWVFKLTSTGNIEWQKTYGGSGLDGLINLIPTSDGGLIGIGSTNSNDNDIYSNHGLTDFWVVKLAFPGVPIVASVSITSDKTTICKGSNVTFVASPTNGGSNPQYQWKINGGDANTNNDTLISNNLNNGDVVQCVLTSNYPCITVPTGTSNNITINVDPSLNPSLFLPPDTLMCSYGKIDLRPMKDYTTYLWSTLETTKTITINKTGNYWLQVTDTNNCKGTDTVTIALKDCLKGFYIPSAFSPNGDHVNDIFKPSLFGNVVQYQFEIYNRWGQLIFKTSDLNSGWDGNFKGYKSDTNIFFWLCNYQFAGEQARHERGTVTLIR